jgi:hypothetical protein
LDPDDTNISRLGRLALENGADTIVISTRTDRSREITYFEGDKALNAFNHKNKSIHVYVANERLKNLGHLSQ